MNSWMLNSFRQIINLKHSFLFSALSILQKFPGIACPMADVAQKPVYRIYHDLVCPDDGVWFGNILQSARNLQRLPETT